MAIWYSTGSVEVTLGSTVVTGTGTDFAANTRVGDAFIGPDGSVYEVVNVTSTVVLSIAPAYKGASGTGLTYTLAPIQGYVKKLADSANSILSQWGGTLALFDGATDIDTLRANIQAAKSGANSDITSLDGLTSGISIAQGGTGATTASAARANLGLGTAAITNVLGATVDGNILERGSNTNGEYLKLVDGTMFCWQTNGNQLTTSVAVGSGFQSPSVTLFTFPAAFVTSPTVGPMIYYRAGSPAQCWGNINTLSATSCSVVIHSFVTGGQAYTGYVAMGRWKV